MKTYSASDVKPLNANLPHIEQDRPNCCPFCKCPSRLQGRIVVHGHGTRERFLVHITQAGVGENVLIKVRRFKCTRAGCARTFSVLPPQVTHRRRYSVAAMVYSLFLWAFENCSEEQIRGQVLPESAYGDGFRAEWPVLRRWVKAAKRRFAEGLVGLCGSYRRQASEVVRFFAAHAAPQERDGNLVLRAIMGANIMPF